MERVGWKLKGKNSQLLVLHVFDWRSAIGIFVAPHVTATRWMIFCARLYMSLEQESVANDFFNVSVTSATSSDHPKLSKLFRDKINTFSFFFFKRSDVEFWELSIIQPAIACWRFWLCSCLRSPLHQHSTTEAGEVSSIWRLELAHPKLGCGYIVLWNKVMSLCLSCQNCRVPCFSMSISGSFVCGSFET